MIWLLFLAVGDGPVTHAQFETELACKVAGKQITKELGKKAQFWCFASAK